MGSGASAFEGGSLSLSDAKGLVAVAVGHDWTASHQDAFQKKQRMGEVQFDDAISYWEGVSAKPAGQC